jgi:hypothetical protein
MQHVIFNAYTNAGLTPVPAGGVQHPVLRAQGRLCRLGPQGAQDKETPFQALPDA